MKRLLWFYNGFSKECLGAGFGLHSAVLKLCCVKLGLTDVLTEYFSCCREVDSDAAEDSSLSKFLTLFLYNKEIQNTCPSQFGLYLWGVSEDEVCFQHSSQSAG